MVVYTDIKQGTPEWLALKAGKIGGTVSGALSGDDPQKALWTLAGEIDTGRIVEGYKSKSMERGNEFEHEGIMELEKELGETIEKVAFVQSSEYDFIGFSPDGLFSARTKVAEMKCPEDGTHVMYCNDDNEFIKAYYNQVRQPFIVDPQFVAVYLTSFNPASKKPLHVVEIKRSYFSEKELINAKMNMKLNYKLALSKAKNLKY